MFSAFLIASSFRTCSPLVCKLGAEKCLVPNLAALPFLIVILKYFKSQIIYLLEEVRVIMSGLELVGPRVVSVSLFMMTLNPQYSGVDQVPG